MFPKYWYFVWIFLVWNAANPCFSRRLFEATTRPKPTGNDKICQDELGHDYVWDDYIQTCVRCITCTPEAKDPHCVTCKALGIPSSGDTAPQPDGGSSTPQPPTHTMTSDSTMTTSSSFSGMKNPSSGDTTPQLDGGSSTSQATLTNDDNKAILGIVIAIFVLIVIVIFIVIFWKLCKCYISKSAESPTPLSKEETGSAADESHAMVELQVD